MNPHALSKAIIDYRRAGIEIVSFVLDVARDGESVTSSPCAEILCHALIYFSKAEWLRLIATDEVVAEAFHRSLELLHYQADVLQASRAALGDGYLAVRRYLHFVAEGAVDFDQIQARVEKTQELPFPFPIPFERTKSLAVDTMKNFLRDLKRILDREPLTSVAGSTGGEYMEPAFEQFFDNKWARFCTLQWSCHDVLRPLLPDLLRSAERLAEQGNGAPDEICFAAIDSLVIYSGLDFRDALRISIGSTSQLSPGRIDLEQGVLIRVFRNGYFRGGTMFRAAELSLPLPPSLIRLLESGTAGRQGTLESIWGSQLCEKYIGRLGSLIGGWQPGMNFRTRALHHSFHAAALFECGLLPSELGLLLGYPVYGTRTQCEYISATEDELLEWWRRIHDQLRGWAGLPKITPPQRVPTGILFGKKAPTHAEWISEIRRRIALAQNWNELVVCMEALSQAIGARNRIHVNPAARLRETPHPHLMFYDKKRFSEPIGLRQLPAIPVLMAFVDLGRCVFGESDLIGYFVDGKWRPSDGVLDRSLFSWLATDEIASIGRTAYINGLRRTGAGGALCSWLSGHQNKDLFHSELLPVPPGRLLNDAAPVLERLLRESKFGDAVRELGEAFNRMPRPLSEPVQLSSSIGDIQNVELKRLAPFSKVEDLFSKRCLEGAFQLGKSLALDPWATGILLSLEAGMPFGRLIADRPHLTFRVFAYDQTSECWFFIPVLEQEDVGHLSPYVFRLPSNSLTVKHAQLRFRQLQSGQKSKSIDQFLNSQLLGSRRTLHAQVKKHVGQLLSRPGDAVTLTARAAIRLVDRISCQLCTHYQPGSVAASLRGAIPFGINHVAVEDVIETMTGRKPRLIDLAEQPWQPWVPVSHRRSTTKPLPSSFQHWTARLRRHQRQFSTSVQEKPVAAIVGLFAANRMKPARDRFREVLAIAGITGTKAECLSRSIYARIRALGNLALTKPARMCNYRELLAIVERIPSVASGLPYFWRTTRSERIRLRERAAQQLALCVFTADRVGETIALEPSEVCSGSYGNFVYIREGKTYAARRAVHVEYIGESPALSLSPLLPRQASEKVSAVAMRLRGLLGKLIPLSLHDLRRSQAWAALSRAIEQIYPSGNLVEFLATLARNFGHRSLITLLHSYAGGMLATLALPPVDWATVRWTRLQIRLGPRVPELLRIYDGTAYALDLLQAAVRSTRSFVSVRGYTESRCWVGEDRCRSQHLRWCDSQSGCLVWPQPLPDRPDLPEFWESIEHVRDLAAARNISILFTMRAKTSREHRERFEAVLGPGCFAGRRM